LLVNADSLGDTTYNSYNYDAHFDKIGGVLNMIGSATSE
jgi:hypothetical protein